MKDKVVKNEFVNEMAQRQAEAEEAKDKNV